MRKEIACGIANLIGQDKGGERMDKPGTESLFLNME